MSERREHYRRATRDYPLFYTLGYSSTLFQSEDTSTPYLELKFQEPVYLMSSRGDWSHVETADGARGYVRRRAISNIWIRVSKSQKTVFVYRGTELLEQLPADLAYNFFSNKVRRGDNLQPDHWRTPEGKFYVVSKNPNSQFHKALVLNYPSSADADRGLRNGVISRSERDAIVAADIERRPPPMTTGLGGLIELHGGGTGARTSWTRGCVALVNESLDRLWSIVQVGTPVLIEP